MKNPKWTLLVIVGLAMICMTSLAQGDTNCACCSEKSRQFDFWLGDWDAFNPAGTLVGTNRILLMQDKCVIQENWVASKGEFTGTSYNFYNTSSGKWEQLWIDNQGGILKLEGGLVGRQMILRSHGESDQKGVIQINRITWTPNADGTVRQLWELSTDNEATWVVAFDGRYKRKS